MSDGPVWYWRLEYHDNATNSHKFYEAFVVDRYSITAWGRDGTKGQYKTDPLNTPAEAKAAGLKIAHSKAAKGYQFTVIEALVMDVDFLLGCTPEDLMIDVRRAVTHRMSGNTGSSPSAVAERANGILSSIEKGTGTSTVLSDWDELVQTWKQTEEDYAAATLVMESARQAVFKKLMG